MRNINLIVLHHSATEPKAYEGDLDGQAMVDIICSNHHRNWSKRFPNYKCDYHYLIGPTGKVFEGQPLEQVGFHCGNYEKNRRSIGICFLGNFEKIKMPMEQFNTGVKLIKDLLKRFNIPVENIELHRDIAPTLCPGKHFPFDKMLKESLNTDVDISDEDIYSEKDEYKESEDAIKWGLETKLARPFPSTPVFLEQYLDEEITMERLLRILFRFDKLLDKKFGKLLDKEVKITGGGSAKNYNLK